MDPNACLKELRELIEYFHNNDADSYDYDDVHELVDKIDALDEWLSTGGFKPSDWS